MSTRVELMTIGDELLLGFTVDTNGAFLAERLAHLGVAVARRTSVGDDLDAIASAVGEALARTGAVITTGGLGPTTDDLTRDAVARVFGVDLRLDEEHLAWMRERWRRRFNREIPASNQRQAMMPAGARKLENRHGSAPGLWMEDARGWVCMLPGVPRELRGMTEDVLLPLVRERSIDSGARILSRTLRTTGIPESLLQDRIAALGLHLGSATLAYLPGVDGVDLRLTGRGPSAGTLEAELATIAERIRTALGDAVYGEERDDLARVFLDRCRAGGLTVAIAESCTGGMLGSRITAIPGSSDVFLGGVIAYANEVKVRELDVPVPVIEQHGAVSEPVVRAMAAGVQRTFGARLGLAITGVAGPSGGTAEKPVGLVWICAALDDRVEPRRLQSWGDRQEIRYRAAQAAMDLARRLLSGAL